MADLGGTFNSDDHKQALFPEGEHAVQIVESDLTQRKNGDGKDWKFKFRVLRGPLQNKDCTFWLAYDIPNATGNMAMALEIGRGMIANICRAVGVLQPKRTEELIEKKLMLTVKHKDGWARIGKVEALKDAPAAPPVVVTADAGGEVKKPAGW